MLKKLQKMCFSPRGSVWSVEGCILLRISLGLAVRHCWSDLEKFPKSAPGEILEGSGQHFGLGTFLGQKMETPQKNTKSLLGGIIIFAFFAADATQEPATAKY